MLPPALVHRCRPFVHQPTLGAGTSFELTPDRLPTAASGRGTAFAADRAQPSLRDSVCLAQRSTLPAGGSPWLGAATRLRMS